MQVTARSLITKALRTLQAIGEGDGPTAEQVVDGFDLLAEVVESWNLQPGSRVFLRRLTHTLTPSTQEYTIGPTGAIVSALRVEGLEAAAYIQPGQTNEIPVHVWQSRQPWELITIKGQTGTIPLGLLIEQTEPDATITLWPIPTEAGTLVLYTLSTVQAFASLDATYQLPQGFAEAFRLELAIRMGPFFHLPVDEDIRAGLREVKGWIKRQNERIPDLGADPMLTDRGFLGSVYDLYAGRG